MKMYLTKPVAKKFFFDHEEVFFEIEETGQVWGITLKNDIAKPARTAKFASLCDYLIKTAGVANDSRKLKFFVEVE